MEYKNFLKEAADEMIHKRLKPGDGGIIAVDKDGNYVMTYNTIGMFRAAANSEGIFEVNIWE
jgi:beta-aspartyl-peptidase (threonine type)